MRKNAAVLAHHLQNMITQYIEIISGDFPCLRRSLKAVIRICVAVGVRQHLHQPRQCYALAQVLDDLGKLPLDTLGHVNVELKHLRHYEESPPTVIVVQMIGILSDGVMSQTPLCEESLLETLEDLLRDQIHSDLKIAQNVARDFSPT